MEPKIISLPPKILVGQKLSMSLANNKTFELWRGFMPRRNEIQHKLNNELFSMQVYDPNFDFSFKNRDAIFDKWAAVEVEDLTHIPNEMASFQLTGGLYAVFDYKGLPAEGASFFAFIFGTWLPQSIYELDQRPHFELLGEKYKNNHPESEEEIWIPIKPKS